MKAISSIDYKYIPLDIAYQLAETKEELRNKNIENYRLRANNKKLKQEIFKLRCKK